MAERINHIPSKEKIGMHGVLANRVAGDSLSAHIFRNAEMPVSAKDLVSNTFHQDALGSPSLTLDRVRDEVWNLVNAGFLNWQPDRKIRAREIVIKD